MKNNWILTASGVEFSLTDPKPEMVRIGDIAEALSRIPRFTGHGGSYSVAQHCVLAAIHVGGGREELPLYALFHDAEEAYIGDVNNPLKTEMRDIAKANGIPASPFDVVGGRVTSAIKQAVGIDTRELPGRQWPRQIHDIDLRLLATERRDFMPQCSTEWDVLAGVEPLTDRITAWPQQRARDEFLRWARMLGVPT